jgi:hypothetical protein
MGKEVETQREGNALQVITGIIERWSGIALVEMVDYAWRNRP